MKPVKFTCWAAGMLLTVCAFGQEFPRYEVGADYSYVRFVPSANSTNNHSLNGGGGSFVFNVDEYFGIKADLQGYASTTSFFVFPPSVNFPGGASGSVSGNLFTYLFGPQIKFRSPKVQPYVHLLVGGAHSNVYGNAFTTICQPTAGACGFSKSPSGNAFAMTVGGGLDIPITSLVSIRPAEIDYLLTDFNNRFNQSNQNNFRYSGGITFTFGGSQ
jgi:opacity protein-like surface antigen